MHKIILILLLIGCTTPAELLAQIDSKPLYKDRSEVNLYTRKVNSYRKMRNTGLVLGVAGAVLTTTGAILLANTTWVEQTSPTGTVYTTTDSGNATGGFLCLFTGIPALGTGIVLGTIGSAKMKQYQKKLDGLSFNFKYTPQQRGIAITYRF